MLTNILSLLFFFLAFSIVTIVDARSRTSDDIVYRALHPGPVVTPNNNVSSSITTDSTTSLFSSSGNFAFGFYQEKEGFAVGIQLLASASETVVVWTARPELKRFTKDAFLTFTEQGIFVTPNKDAKAFPLFKFSYVATSPVMLNTGNLVVYGNSTLPSSKSSNSTLLLYSRGIPYTRSCDINEYCRDGTGSDNSSYNIIWRSFDFPTDTILGGQILPCGYNLTSSANETDHSIGNYTLNLSCHSANLISFRLNSTDKNWDTGFSNGDYKNLNLDEDGRLYLTSYGEYAKDLFVYNPRSSEILYRATLDHDGIFRLYALDLVVQTANP